MITRLSSGVRSQLLLVLLALLCIFYINGLDISFNIVDALFNFVNIWRVDKRVFFCASQATLSMGSTIHSYAVYIRSIFSKTL